MSKKRECFALLLSGSVKVVIIGGAPLLLAVAAAWTQSWLLLYPLVLAVSIFGWIGLAYFHPGGGRRNGPPGPFWANHEQQRRAANPEYWAEYDAALYRRNRERAQRELDAVMAENERRWAAEKKR